MASTPEVPVFTDTNLGTHIAMAVLPDITAGDFKRELERRHFSCFPKLGEIKVYGLMVKRRSCFYHLPESVPIKHAFQGLKGTWFLRIEARPLNGLDRPVLSKRMAAKVADGNNVTDSLITTPEKNDIISNVIKPLPEELPKTVLHSKKKKKKRVNNFLEYRNDGIENECHGRNEETPVVNSKESLEGKEEQPKAKRDDNFLNIQADALPQFTVRTPPRTFPFLSPTDPRPGTSRNKHRTPETEIGKRFVIASNNLRISTNKQRPAISSYRRKNGKLLGRPNASSLAKYLVFDISDNED